MGKRYHSSTPAPPGYKKERHMTVDQFVRQQAYLKELVLASLEPSERKGRVRFADFIDQMPDLRESLAIQFAANDLLPEPKVNVDGTEEFSTKKVALLLGISVDELKAYLKLNQHKRGTWQG
jgi:hypothetical protein